MARLLLATNYSNPKGRFYVIKSVGVLSPCNFYLYNNGKGAYFTPSFPLTLVEVLYFYTDAEPVSVVIFSPPFLAFFIFI